MILSALLPSASFAEEAQAQASGAGSSSSGSKSAGEGVHKVSPKMDKKNEAGAERGSAFENGAIRNNVADAPVDVSIRPHPHPRSSHVKAPAKGKGSKPALGAYTKKYQRHVGGKGGEKEKAASGDGHASVPGESLKEQESKLHRMANPRGSATEAPPVVRHAAPTPPVSAGNSAVRGQGLVPTPGRRSPNPAIIDGRTITSRTQGNSAIGGTTMTGSH